MVLGYIFMGVGALVFSVCVGYLIAMATEIDNETHD